ncbi:cystathionine beta-lyase [Pseudomonas sp. S 311-6]|uniref:Cystathionine beta-lyase n=2 Tax=Kerstersia gyiorum TaxID=206506 RepID=A0A4Q7MW22_9BURK|nr:cystathionine beta-lyase [Kerstersia gyiorum]MCO7636851.1 cystathionine beta-lyase [Pseudomonas sp. S 311-6]MCP1631732.1 cystathionine beta-lyase [Kerstersia gyiorum]MCP1636760.1 cystathionine beta-lyase [Kerstersia gyiorum]MCP1671487.1 cystathionine beta-lyase [Kerstersia gyiorum]
MSKSASAASEDTAAATLAPECSVRTRLMHIGSAPFDADGVAPVSLPAMRTSTVRFADLAALENAQRRKAAGERAITYGRSGMETHRALEDAFVALEGGSHCVLAPSGLAALTLVFFSLLGAGDHALVVDSVYGPVRHFDNMLLKKMGVEITYFTPGVDDLESLIRPNTRLLYLESPGSLLLQMQDLPALAAIGHRHGLLVAADNTWGSGHAYHPLALGADISMIAGTKYVSGHSDLMLGAVVTRDAALGDRISRMQYALGYALSADDAWLALRGLRTLPLRMDEQARSALRVCEFLASRPETRAIYHPAWPGDAGHALWQRDAQGSNGLLSVALDLSHDAGRRFVDALTLFGIGFSWGGFESLVQWVEPALAGLQRYGAELPGETLIRLQIGLEDADELIADLRQALDAAVQA